MPLQWRHNGRDSVSNHQPHDCVLNRLFRRRSEKTSKLRVTGHLCGELTSPRWIPRTNGQLRGKCFHLMTSCWHRLEIVGKVWWAIYKSLKKWVETIHQGRHHPLRLQSKLTIMKILWTWLIAFHEKMTRWGDNITCHNSPVWPVQICDPTI